MEHAARGVVRARGRSAGSGRRTRGRPTAAFQVRTDGVVGEALRAVHSVVELVGGEVQRLSDTGGADNEHRDEDPRAPDLVVVSDVRRASTWRGRGVPVVVVGPGGALHLPGEEVLLAELVGEVALQARMRTPGAVGPPGGSPVGEGVGPGAGPVGVGAGAGRAGVERARGLVVGIAGWEGGVGTTTLVRSLARCAGGVAVDATGVGPGLVAPGEESARGVRWADLSVLEGAPHPDLVSRLPVVGGSPALVADHRGGATCADPRLRTLVRHLSRSHPVVMDLGRWDKAAAELTGQLGGDGVEGGAGGGVGGSGGSVDVLCLVGRGDDDSVRGLAAATALWPPACPLVVVHARRSPSPLVDTAMGAPVGSQGWVTWRLPPPGAWWSGRTGLPRRRVAVLWERLVRLSPPGSRGGNPV